METLKLHYSGTITSGRIRKFLPDPPAAAADEEARYWGLVMKTHGLEAAIALRTTLGLSLSSKSHRTSQASHRARRGSKGISPYGRRLVKDAALLLEEGAPRNTLSFLTVTIPPAALTPKLFESWSDCVRVFQQRLKRVLVRAGLPDKLCGVVEVQERRLSREGGSLPLHLHLVFQGRKARGSWVLKTHDMDKIWKETLSRYSGVNVDVTSSCNLQRVKKSCAGYLGKYLSKGAKALETANPDHLPPAWYMCSRSLFRRVKLSTLYCTGIVAEQLKEYVSREPRLLRFQKDIVIELSDGTKYGAGWLGELSSRAAYREFAETWRVLVGESRKFRENTVAGLV